MFTNKRIHMIGIGGVSMSGIAEMLLNMNATVTGSDITESKITNHLENLGIKILYGHHPELINNCDLVIYTADIKENDPERITAKELGIPTYERAVALGILSKEYKNCLCISGTHGKSTTTGLVSLIFMEANLNPTIQIGAILPEINGTSKIGSKDYLIMEACEYVDSFLNFHPTCEIITNIDNDHLDYFKNLDNIKNSFNKYTNLLPENGYLIKNNDDINSKNVEKNTKAKIITYGIENEANFMAKEITFNENGCYSFDIYYNNEFYNTIHLNIPGKHNIYNALAATALTNIFISDKNIIKKGIEKYQGVKRRFEYIGKYKNCSIYDDYAHHPTEIKATFNSVKQIKHHESWAIFQPHTYSRTKKHLDGFADILSKFDHIIIADIYAARETNTFNISEDMLVNKIKEKNGNVIHINSFDKIVNYLKENIQDNDLVITIGAGPINKVAENLKE